MLSSCTLALKTDTFKFILYPVKAGDTVATISSRFHVTQQQLLTTNHLQSGGVLDVGTVLKIPYQGQDIRKQKGDLPNPRVPRELIPDKGSTKKVSLLAAKRYIGKLGWAVEATHVVSPFGSRWGNFHEGIDLGAPEGEAIYAAHDGQIAYSGDGLRGYGKLIVVKTEGLLTVYAHNSKNIVAVGDKVRKGQKIGLVGQTGKATGPHVHFETRVEDANGKYVAVDPLVFYR